MLFGCRVVKSNPATGASPLSPRPVSRREVLAVGRVASFVDELAHGFAGCRGADLAADELGSFADPIAWRVACCRIVCRWVGRVQRVVAIDRLPRARSGYSALLSLVRFIDMVCSLVSGGYRPRVSEMPEQAFRITLRAVLVNSAHEVRDVSVRRRLSDEFRLVAQNGFQLEHA